MKTKYILAASLMLLGLVSCDKFLDVMPDNRTELDSADKIRRLLVTAYPAVDYLYFNELDLDRPPSPAKTVQKKEKRIPVDPMSGEVVRLKSPLPTAFDKFEK